MKFALVNNIKSEATKGSIGNCQCCGATLIAKCGTIKVNHWAHKSKRKCDAWWEGETEWHRSWKSNFPIEWQEIIMHDEVTNEKHIADVKTKHGLVIEFQHSAISPEEQKSRELFYKNMVWVVDGARLKSDYPKFLTSRNHFISTNKPKIFGVNHIEGCFPENWANSFVPIVLDFQNAQASSSTIGIRNNLYCLFPNHLGDHRIIAEMSRTAFIKNIKEGEWSRRVNSFIENIDLSEQLLLKRDEEVIDRMIQNKIPQRYREGAKKYMKEKFLNQKMK